MISEATRARLLELQQNQNSYHPNEAYGAQLADREALLLVAPAAGGKSFIMQRIARLSSRHVLAGNGTSREPRDDDKTRKYHYVQHSDKGLAPLFQRIASGNVVQYAVFPDEALHLYFTYASDFPGKINMMDMLANGVKQARRLPFRRVSVVNLITPPSDWTSRFDERFPLGHHLRQDRRDQAADSLRWSLEQPEGSTHWIVNAPGRATDTAKQIIALADGRHAEEAPVRRLAEQCLDAALGMEV